MATSAELASRLKVSKRTVLLWASEGKITARATLPNGARRWDLADTLRQLGARKLARRGT